MEKKSDRAALLNHSDRDMRLDALRALADQIAHGAIDKPALSGAVNNHIHTFYSFSPYSPSKAVWLSYISGLATAGIMDHDTISGAREFIEAGRIIGLATTIGLECRADFSRTPLKGRRINHPDQISSAYIALHGIPHTQIDTVATFFSPFLQKRNVRNRRMTEKINTLLAAYGVRVDFDRDVVPLSMSREGGSITERHLLFALSQRLIQQFGKGKALVDFLTTGLQVQPGEKIIRYLQDKENPYYAYDLLGALKSELVPRFYIDADEECPDAREVVEFARHVGAISAYAYLGDIAESVTGDKKSQKFEDDYLDLLFETLKELGFNAVTYMPSRNTAVQLERVQQYCRRYGFFQISGEDINSPRQSFICEAMQQPSFSHLVDATWALIGHERAATKDLSAGMFTPETVAKYPDLQERIAVFRETGLNEKTGHENLP